MKLRRYIFNSIFAVLLLAIGSCQKGSGGSSEANLTVVTSPVADGHVEAPAPGPNFPLTVTVTSKMPSSGVKIDVTAKPDGGTVAFFSTSTTTTTAATTFSITNTTQGVTSVVNITVTSLSSSSNVWTGSYKYSRK